MPSVTWTKDGKQLTSGDNVAITSDSSLVITQADTEDSAKYICNVQGLTGSDTASSVVQILGEYLLFYYSFSHYESDDYCGKLQKLIPCSVEMYSTGSKNQDFCEHSPGSQRCEVYVAFTAFQFLLLKITLLILFSLLSSSILKAIPRRIYTKEDVNFRRH